MYRVDIQFPFYLCSVFSSSYPGLPLTFVQCRLACASGQRQLRWLLLSYHDSQIFHPAAFPSSDGQIWGR